MSHIRVCHIGCGLITAGYEMIYRIRMFHKGNVLKGTILLLQILLLQKWQRDWLKLSSAPINTNFKTIRTKSIASKIKVGVSGIISVPSTSPAFNLVDYFYNGHIHIRATLLLLYRP